MRFGFRSIDLGLWDRITREVVQYPWATVRIHSVGEPVLWDGLPEALAIAHLNGVRSWIFTSAVTTDRALLDLLMRRCDVVEVSRK